MSRNSSASRSRFSSCLATDGVRVRRKPVHGAEAWWHCPLRAAAGGGPHLPDVARQIARGIERRWGAAVETPLNILIGENYYRPAALLREQILRQLAVPAHPYFERWIGLVELQVLRSCMEPTPEL